jgi:Arc/MetJ-type ribon-helix-helix transcriptional regulator
MNTLNISLTSDQISWINNFTQKLGFANRSEFIRSILRFLAKREDLLSGVQTYPFISPATVNKKQIISDFRKTKKYSAEFIKDLEEGLARSDYFK